MELKLQSILFPDKEEYTDYADLFYKGGLGIQDKEEKCFVFSKYSTCDFHEKVEETYQNRANITKISD